MKYCYLDSPVGRLLLAGDEQGLKLLSFPTGKMAQQPKADWTEDSAAFVQARQQLKEYFAGKRKTFDLKLSPHGTTFQLEVLKGLRQIPYGQTCSYAELAQRIGRPKAVRAVGAANGRNPL
ncbi:MAG: methylated-DNA--[protein]-cysteine S-methyltransferase, partial [Salinisphaeraceae bacterium]|nr:methylated-DNA--[protein]-cysteine S-methyltransferase [Salinisphaeraceae bacterium]